MVGEKDPGGWYKHEGLSLGKRRRGATQRLPHHRTAQNNRSLNDKGGNTKNNHAVAGASQRARYPHSPAPCQLPACLPWGAPARLQEEQAFCSWQCFPSSPSSCHPGASLLHSFARICCSGRSFSKRGHILLSASKAALSTAKSYECHKSDENQTAEDRQPRETFSDQKTMFL